MNSTEETVLTLVANVLFGANRDIPKGVDWHDVYQECCHQAIPAIGLKGAQAANIPDDCLRQWTETVMVSACQNYRVTEEHLQWDCWMKQAKIPYVVLKGCACARYYPAPIDRTMGDVDVLVSKKDLQRAGKILEMNGFIPWDQDHACHVVYQKPPTHYEVHFEPTGIPDGTTGDLIRSYLQNIMEEAIQVPYESGTICCPSDFHHGLILLLHTCHHLLEEGIGLRHLCDWAVFAASFTDQEFCEIFEGPLHAVGLWKFAQVLTQISRRWLGCPYREWAGTINEELADAMMRDILDSGNFGRKSEVRAYEAYYFSHQKADVWHAFFLGRLLCSLNGLVRSHWPFAEKCWLLYPLGWVYFSLSYAVKILKGQRAFLRPRQVIGNAVKRRDIYEACGLLNLSKH